MAYNLTQVANVTNFLEFTQNVNHYLMNDLLGVLLLFAIGVICVSSFHWSTRDLKGSILATSFILFTLSLLMRAINLVPNLAVFITLIGCAAAVAFSWKQ